MNSTKIDLKQVEEDHYKKETSFSRVFDFGTFKCEYFNSNKMREAHDNQKTPTLVVSNYLCKREGNVLRKIIEIRLDDKVITIEDKFMFQNAENLETKDSLKFSDVDSLSEDLEQESSGKRKIIRKKTNKTLMPKKRHIKVSSDCGIEDPKRDTKNVPRNISRAFSNYLYEANNSNFQLMSRLTDQAHYNNSLVEGIIKHPQLALVFQEFLQGPALKWIQSSRIKDKRSHEEAINIYLRILDQANDRQIQDCIGID